MINKAKTKRIFGYKIDLSKRAPRNSLKANNIQSRFNLLVIDICPICKKERTIRLIQSIKNLPCRACSRFTPKMIEANKKQKGKVISKETRQKMKENHWSKKGGIPWQKGKPFSEKAKKKMIQTNIERGHIKGVVDKNKKIPMSQFSKENNIGYEKFKIWMKNNKTATKKEIKKFVEGCGYKNQTNIENIMSSMLKVNKFDSFLSNLKYKPDFELIKDSLYLNVDGLYWHSEVKKKDKYYHFNMRKAFEFKNKRILQFREDEIYNKKAIVESIIINVVGNTPNKESARKLMIKKISNKQAEIFLNQNHLMGGIKAKHVGLVDKKGAIISLLSYKIFNNSILKIERFCSLVGWSVIGGFSKLLSHIEKIERGKYREVHNWVDLRYGTGDHLKSKGFVLERETLGWKWTDWTNTYNRLHCRANMDKRRLSEAEHAKEMKLVKIYDAGQRLYIKRRENEQTKN
jgi:hypothetical protein